jgi:hypothetical protein
MDRGAIQREARSRPQRHIVATQQHDFKRFWHLHSQFCSANEQLSTNSGLVMAT